MINVKLEKLVHFNEARHSFPGRTNIALATLHRWRLSGVRGAKLETVMVGNRRFTSEEAIDRFIAAQNPEPTVAAPAITPSQRRRQAEAANQLLIEQGI